MAGQDLELFTLHVQFERHSPKPSRLFQAMKDLVEAFQESDRICLKGFSNATELTPELFLEDVQAGSIRLFLAQKVLSVLSPMDDEAIKSGEWQKALGAYLLKAKQALVKYTEKRQRIESSRELHDLQKELQELAERASVSLLPAYQPPSSQELLGVLQMLGNSTQTLRDGDTVTLESSDGSVELSREFMVSDADIKDLLTKESITNAGYKAILRVKRPDFLGDAQWEFKGDMGTIKARIEDGAWLGRFHGKEVVIKPGDSLRVRMSTTVGYGHDQAVVNKTHVVTHVDEVISGVWSDDAQLPMNET